MPKETQDSQDKQGHQDKRTWFDRLFGSAKRKPNPVTADPKTVDSEAMGIGAEAVLLARRAASAGVALKDQLVERREAVIDRANAGQYEAARQLLAALRTDVQASIERKEAAALYADPPDMTADELDEAAQLRLSIAQDIDALKLKEADEEIDRLFEITAHASFRHDLGLDRMAAMVQKAIDAPIPDAATPREKADIEKLRKTASDALAPPLTATKIEAARAGVRSIEGVFEAIERRLEVATTDPGALYEKQALRLKDVAEYPAEFRSVAVRKLIDEVDVARMDAQLKLADWKRAAQGQARDKAATAALAAIATMRQRIDVAAKALGPHDAEVRKFYAKLKRMRPQLEVADGLPTDNPAWRDERAAYGKSRDRIVKLQDEQKFREANLEFANCAVLMKALFDKRRTSLDGDIATAGGDADQIKTLVDDLETKNQLSILSVQQQLELLRELPAGTHKKTRKKILANASRDEAFVEAEEERLKQVVVQLRGSDGKNATPQQKEAKRQWTEAEDNWEEWTKPGGTDDAKVKAALERIVKVEFAELAKLAGYTRPQDYPPGFPDPPALVVFGVGGVTPGLDPQDFAMCSSGAFPAKITLNRNHRGFGDFKEMVDTILHENTHAWQTMLIKQFNEEAPFGPADKARLTGPNAAPTVALQAELFAQNEDTYATGGKAYMHQPVEEQAWQVGGKNATKLLVPPPLRSMESGRGLKNEFWMVASLTRTAPARVRLRERHGIIGSEWEGEEASDKKLTLEGVPGLATSGQDLRPEVIDQYTLELNLDASTLRGRMVPMSEVRMEMLALAKTRHQAAKLDALSDGQRKTIFDEVVLAGGWVSSGGADDREATVRATDEVDVEHARLVLDRTVAKLA